VKLTKSQIENGIEVSSFVDVPELPLHRLKRDVLSEVQYGRKAMIVTLQGKARAILLPIPA